MVFLLPSAVRQLGQVTSANTTMHQEVHAHCATTGAAGLAAGRLLGMATSVHPHLHVLHPFLTEKVKQNTSFDM